MISANEQGPREDQFKLCVAAGVAKDLGPLAMCHVSSSLCMHKMNKVC